MAGDMVRSPVRIEGYVLAAAEAAAKHIDFEDAACAMVEAPAGLSLTFYASDAVDKPFKQIFESQTNPVTLVTDDGFNVIPDAVFPAHKLKIVGGAGQSARILMKS